jgi:hypothetical protein
LSSSSARDKVRPASSNRPSSLRSKLKIAAAALVVAFTLLACALLWRPSGASREGAAPNFVAAVVAHGLPAAELLTDGHAKLKLTESAITDVGAAVLDRNADCVPPGISKAVARKVPSIVDTICGCHICPDGVTLYVRCREGVSFYPTVSGVVERTPDGGLTFSPTSASIGLLPIPMGLVKYFASVEKRQILDPESAGVIVTKLTLKQGALIVELRAL